MNKHNTLNKFSTISASVAVSGSLLRQRAIKTSKRSTSSFRESFPRELPAFAPMRQLRHCRRRERKEARCRRARSRRAIRRPDGPKVANRGLSTSRWRSVWEGEKWKVYEGWSSRRCDSVLIVASTPSWWRDDSLSRRGRLLMSILGTSLAI